MGRLGGQLSAKVTGVQRQYKLLHIPFVRKAKGHPCHCKARGSIYGTSSTYNVIQGTGRLRWLLLGRMSTHSGSSRRQILLAAADPIS